ncbi:MAG: potassium channel family protein [Limisphaerales bacterium]
MKTLVSQLTAFLKPGSSQRNVRLLFRFLAVLGALVTAYTVIFHLLMLYEGQEHSWLSGLYWTMVVMSTLGFGDITFTSDIGRIFSVVVLLSGIMFLLVLLPFTFIEFFYAPWMQAQSELRAPRQLPESTEGHVIITNYDSVTTALMHKLDHYKYPYVLLVNDLNEALKLHDMGMKVMFGEVDRLETYKLARVDKAALIAATGTDVVNTNIAFTAREMSSTVPIATTASFADSVDILQLAGSSHVIQLAEMMGQSLARRISGVDARTHVIGQFGELLIAEATASGTPLVGKTLAQSGVREHAGVSIIGVWKRGKFETATAETKIDAHSVLVLAGSQDQLNAYDELFCIYHVSGAPVIIVGGGRVGRATARALEEREVDYRIVEPSKERIRSDKYVLGSAADLATLERAGIKESPAIVITPHEDDTNIYLTIYCRRLRPDIQIITRATRERNVATMHRAGADFVLSYASMGATAIFNFLRRTDILMVTEGLHVAETEVPPGLVGMTLAEAAIPRETQCTVVALRTPQGLKINPEPSLQLPKGAEIILICTPEGEERFIKRYGAEDIKRKPISSTQPVDRKKV